MMRGKATLAAGLSLTLLAAAGFCRERSRPNIIVITADAMRADMGGFSGDGEVKTPHLDALAGQGVVFERAYTNITTTTPSHATIFSSLYPFQHRAYSNKARISDRIDTLFEIMRGAGWHTAAIVNMRWLNPEVSNIVQGVEELARCRHVRGAAATNRWVLPFLDRQRDGKKPFLLWVHYVDTHTPYRAPGKYARRYYPAGRDPRDPRFTSLAEAWKQFPAHHRDNEFIKRWLGGITDVDYVIGTNKGSVSWLDENVGRLRAKLRELGLERNTILIWMTDNGTSCGCRLDNQGFVVEGYNAGMRGKKGSYYDGGHRVPFFIRWPAGGIPAGMDVRQLITHMDLLPTFIELCGLQAPEVEFDGVSVAPLLRGEAMSLPDREIFVQYRQYTEPPEKWTNAVMTRDWRLIEGRELYYMPADPGQRNDVSEQYPDVVRRLREAHERWWDEVSPRLEEYCPISIRSDEENPTRLCAMDVMGDVAWNQPHIKAAQQSTGKWAVYVERDGDYEFELRRWPKEEDRAITDGIEGTGVKPGVIKVAGNHVPLNEVERKLFLVTGKVQKMTGLPVCCHTCTGARPQFDTLREGGADPTKLYFSHVGDNYYKPGWEGRTLLEQRDYLLKVAEEGGSLLFNNWSMEAHTPVFHMAFLIKELVRAGFARRVLLSEDHAYEFDEHGRVLIEHADEYDPEKPETWGVRERLGYDHVIVAGIPSLIGLGLRPDVIDTFMIENPRAMFTRSE